MPNYYGQTPSTNITVNPGGSTGEKISGLAGMLKGNSQKNKDTSKTAKLLATAAGAVGANEASILLGNENIVDAMGKGIGSLGEGAIDVSKALGGIQSNQAEALKQVVQNVSGKVNEASQALQNSPFGKIHPIRDAAGAFIGATDHGKLWDSKLTEWANKGLGTEGNPTYLEEIGGLGLGGLAAYGLIKGAKAVANRKMYKADREAEHAHDLELAREVRNTGTENLFRLDKAKNLRG